MKPNTPWQPVTAADIHWQNGTPKSDSFDDVYYSQEDGLGESRHVFLTGNDLPARWSLHKTRTFTIGETGFGTGLNFLLTWQAWKALRGTRPRLHYVSVEKHPLRAEDLQQALGQWLELGELGRALLAKYPGLLPGQHRLVFEQGDIVLDLWWTDVREALADLATRQQPYFDAWFLDGFAPARNPEMWEQPLLSELGNLSRPHATFATFTAAGAVRRGLASAGFEVTKVPGFGRKRECLRGSRDSSQPAGFTGTKPDWDLPAQQGPLPDNVLVIGAGLAGCNIASALARRGIRVSLLDKSGLASGASANEQGILYTRLSRKHSALTDFALQSYRFASNFYRSLLEEDRLLEGIDGQLCGCFQANSNTEEMNALNEPLASLPELARVVDAGAANMLTGLEQGSGGYWLPGSGWMHPAGICKALVQHENIDLLENCGSLSLQPIDGGWRACSPGKVLVEAPVAVVAAGLSSTSLDGLDWLPLQRIRGQTTALPASDSTAGLRTAFCHEGYIAPARQGHHCIGATFDVGDSHTEIRVEDNRHNLDSLGSAIPGWAEELSALDPGELGARVGFRCASPDYLPLVGAIPDRDAFLQDFAGLRQNARRRLNIRGRYMQGLYLSTGHGSRGLTSTPLAAELLASMICREPLPLGRTLCSALSPARFLIRNLRRNRI